MSVTSKHVTLLAFAIAAVVPVAGAAASPGMTPAVGTFQGTTAQSHAISFKVVSRARIVGPKSTKIAFRCPDRTTGSFTMTDNLLTIPVRQGKFTKTWKGTTLRGVRYQVKFAGTFSTAKRASGTIQVSATFASSGTCSSGPVSWSARHP